MKNKMNKKGAAYGSDFVLGIIILIVFLIFLFGGGFKTILNITSAVKSIPKGVWIFFGALILIKIIGGKK